MTFIMVVIRMFIIRRPQPTAGGVRQRRGDTTQGARIKEESADPRRQEGERIREHLPRRKRKRRKREEDVSKNRAARGKQAARARSKNKNSRGKSRKQKNRL